MLLLSEFESMTGIYPSINLFAVIQEYFEKSRFDKQEFCRWYGLNVNRIAEEIQIETNVRACENAWKAGMMLGKTKLENEKAVVKTLAEILKRAGEISHEDFDAIIKQCEIQK